MALAVAAIGNGGELLKPNLLLGTVEENGYVDRTARREVLSRPVKRSSADSLRSFMRGVVEHGTGKPVNSEFVSIAGKTGTGEIPDLINGGYYKNQFMASFCGFFPSDAPVIAGIVVLKDPKPITYGGHTAGPAFRRIAERYTVSNPDLFEVTERTYAESPQRLEITSEVPDLVGRDISEALELAETRGVKLRCSSAEGTVTWQFPPPDRLILIEDELLVEVNPEDDSIPVMMDLRGLTIRKASAWLSHHGIKFTVNGSGRVSKQSVRPGEEVKATEVCRLTCRS
jgi:membrane peptidoglycan carboxypeptidase